MDWASFNNAPKRIQNGGWARQVTQDDFAISRHDLGRQHAADRRRHPGIALAPGGRVGDHDLRQLPRHGSRCHGPPLCRRRQRRRPLVFSGRPAAFAARPRPRRLRIRDLLRRRRRQRVQHAAGDGLVRPHASRGACQEFRRSGRDVRQDPAAKSLDLPGHRARRSGRGPRRRQQEPPSAPPYPFIFRWDRRLPARRIQRRRRARSPTAAISRLQRRLRRRW